MKNMQDLTVPNMPPIRCPACGGDLFLRRSKFGLFYGCENYPNCTMVHGAHFDGRPLGTPGDAPTRAARVRAHKTFDRLWQGEGARMKRKHAYSWLREVLGADHQPHIGDMDVTQCEQVISLVNHYFPSSTCPICGELFCDGLRHGDLQT